MGDPDELAAVVDRARDEARALGHTWIGTEHLLLALLASGVPHDLGAGVTYPAALRAVELLAGGPSFSDEEPALTPRARAALAQAVAPGALYGALMDAPAAGARAVWSELVEPDVTELHADPVAPLGVGDPLAQALEVAHSEARHHGHARVEPEHLLAGLVVVAQEEVSRLLGQPVDVGRITDRTFHFIPSGESSEDGPLPLSPGAIAALEAALVEAGGRSIEPIHLLLGLLDAAPDACARVLFDARATARRVRGALDR